MVALNTQEFDTVLEVECRLCGADHVIFVKNRDYISWMNRDGFIQDIMPYLSAADRELLISNTCGDCFNELFPPLDNDE